MPSKHGKHVDPPLTVRPPAELKQAAQQLLAGRGLQMRAFVVACLTALKKDPDQFLADLKPHWPAPKPHRGGRPPTKPEKTS